MTICKLLFIHLYTAGLVPSVRLDHSDTHSMPPKKRWTQKDAAGAGFSIHNFFHAPPAPPPGPGRPKKNELGYWVGKTVYTSAGGRLEPRRGHLSATRERSVHTAHSRSHQVDSPEQSWYGLYTIDSLADQVDALSSHTISICIGL